MEIKKIIPIFCWYILILIKCNVLYLNFKLDPLTQLSTYKFDDSTVVCCKNDASHVCLLHNSSKHK